MLMPTSQVRFGHAATKCDGRCRGDALDNQITRELALNDLFMQFRGTTSNISDRTAVSLFTAKAIQPRYCLSKFESDGGSNE